MKRSILLTIAFICFSIVSINAQNGGMRAYVGTTVLSNNDGVATPGGSYHSGFHFGADGRLMSGNMSFVVGARYTSVGTLPNEEFTVVPKENRLNLMNGRGGLEITLLSITDWFRFRTKALASFDVVLSNAKGVQPAPGYKLNDGWLGLVSGLGVDLGPATLDVEYEFGIINAYNKRANSHFNSLTVSAGFFF